MRVLFVANVDFALRHFILPLMRAARARGHEVFAACAEGPLLDLPRAEGFTVIPVPVARSLSPSANLRAFRALRHAIREVRPDLVHGHFPITGLLARLAARAERVPRTAYTVHGFLFNQPGRPWRRALSLGVEWLGGRLTDIFLTVSEEEAAQARRLRIHPHPIAVRNGRDPARFRPDTAARAAVRAELGEAPDAVVITAISRLVRHKGYPELLRAMEAVPEASLWVVGERLSSDHGASMEPEFERAAALLGPRLRRLGYRHDTERVLAASDLFCLPSHFEGLPMSVIEAMMTGLPVVATDIGGPREQVVPERTGLLVPPATVEPLAEALNRLSRDRALRARMGEAGRARALSLYDEDTVIRHTLDALGLG